MRLHDAPLKQPPRFKTRGEQFEWMLKTLSLADYIPVAQARKSLKKLKRDWDREHANDLADDELMDAMDEAEELGETEDL